MTPEVVEVDPLVDRRWSDLVASTDAGVFHSPAWIGAVAEAYEFDARAVLVCEGDRVLAGMPFVRAEGVRGSSVVVGPFSDYCDPIIVDTRAWPVMASWIAAQDAPVRMRTLRWREPAAERVLTGTGRAHWHGLHIGRDPNELWEAMHPSARRAIRKAENSPLEVAVAESVDELRAFHRLHVDVRRNKYRLLAQPVAFFEAIWRNFVEEGRGHLRMARLDGELVAGVLFLRHGAQMYYKFNASAVNHLDVRPNDAIIWSAAQYAIEEGIELIDFGLSDWNQEGLARYKSKFGSEAGVIEFLVGGPSADPPAIAGVFEPLTLLLTDPDLPADVATRAGELLYRWFV